MIDSFLSKSDEEVVAFLVAHQEEMDTEIDPGKTLASIADGSMVIERRAFGVAIVEVEERPRWHFSPGANLCFLYVLPQYRRNGVGRQFVEELLAKHCKIYVMSLFASEPWRVNFYKFSGFQVVEDMGNGSFRMETLTEDEQRDH